MANKCVSDERIQAIWVGGSLASGTGDAFSDIDFRIAVKPGQVSAWVNPEWDHYLPILPCGGTLMQFGDQALLHHLVLKDGTIVDFFVQDTERQNFEPHLVIIACRDDALKKKLEGFARPVASLVKEVDSETLERFFVDYWITTHKEVKALARDYTLSPFVGLYWERLALLRAYYVNVTGKDIVGRATLHMLGALHKGLEDKITEQQEAILGLPSRTPSETIIAIEAIRVEMAHIGRQLADKYAFAYPHVLEEVVQLYWNTFKVSLKT
ncbi:MAG: hypothetical protein AAF126_07915 [Chloroflexota bacterium]